MNIQDRRGSLTAEELRQKYNLDALTKDRKAIENTAETLTQLNNEQNNMIEAIVLSLSGIDIQTEITLWFDEGVPTILTVPYTDWETGTESDHIGDLYFDRDTGYVYQFDFIDEVFLWKPVTETNLIQAMALSNAAIDTSDRQRKVFLTTPTPAYSNGDWYIKDNGDLYICQISKTEEEVYNEYDFIIASKYALGTQAAEANKTLVIMAGQVTTIIESVSSIEEQLEENKYYIDEDGVKQVIATQLFNLEKTVDGIEQTIQYSGGYNLLENCLKQFGEAGWDGAFTNVTNTEIKQNSMTKTALNFKNDTETRTVQVPNGTFNFSCKYKKLIELANCSIKINDYEILLDDFSGTWYEEDYTFIVDSNTVTLEFIGDTADSLWMVDVLLIPGDIKQIWTPNPNEIDTGVIKMGGDTLTISSTNARTKFEATTDGIRIKNTNTDVVTTEYTEDGTKTNKLEAKTAEIARVIIQSVGNQTWFTRV